jgi:chromosome segregation ATPase
MSKSDKPVPEMVRAAEALEEEIVRLEAISRSSRKIRLNSDKNIARAAAELNEALTLPERLAERLRALATAMGNMQERQQAALEPLAAFALEIQQRKQRLEGHMHSFATLGKAAGEINAQLQLAAGQADRAAVALAEARLQELSDAARALFEAARDDDFPEVAREADVLKQRMAALRKRLGQPPN